MPEEKTAIAAGIRRSERRNWQLWIIAVLVMLALTATLIGVNFSNLFETPDGLAGQAKTYLFGLALLMLLFCSYILRTTLALRTLRLELMQKELENAYIAQHDGVTGLPKRQLMTIRFGQALTRLRWLKRRLAVLYLDLDQFKRINETLGRAVGDLALKAVAERLTTCVREGDIVCRQDDDEFTVVLADLAREEDVFHLAKKVLETIASPLVVQEHKLLLTASMGISLFPTDGEQAEALLKNAETAMPRAKEQGGNNYQLYSAALHARAVERLSLEASLQRALERQEFFLHYQPQIDLKTRRIAAMEALVRWQQPEAGVIPPSKFIPMAEELGLMIPLGQWVLRTACAQNKAWQDGGLPAVPISVNLTGRQFKDKDLAQALDRILRETDLNPTYLELELTENLIQNPAHATQLLAQLYTMGMRFALDDFGTGYSSLSHLKQMPIYKLKIDLSFVRKITTDRNDAAVVAAIIQLAHSLDMKVVAEGVETQEQLDYLNTLHCDEVQGYLFSRPVPAETASQLLARGTA
jgi:diguanylate cyclase (GGDEF)-like protein